MTIFDGDFDWEDMAIAGSLAEEMAAEERERRRLRRELEEDEDEDGLDEAFVIRPSRRRRISRAAPLYLKYTNDLLQKKRLERELFQRCKGSLEAYLAAETETGLMGVRIRNAQLVSDKLFYFLYQVICCHPQLGLRAIRFTSDGTPVVNGREEFGIFAADTRAITINLRLHFENTARVIEMGRTGFSLRALIWDSVVSTLLHECKHALDTAGATPAADAPRDEQEFIADQWASEAMTFFATHGRLEPPPLADEPYFGALLMRYLEQAIAAGAPWGEEQKRMLERGVFYRNEEAGIEILTAKAYRELSLAGQAEDGEGRRLNDCVRKEQALMQAGFERVEKCEQALRTAIAQNAKMRVVCQAPETQKRSVTIVPEMLVKRGPFGWVKASEVETGQTVEMRIDRIEEFEHLR